MLSRLKFKIEPLVKEMLDQIPQDILIYGTVLDPAMGGGQFIKEVERRKRAAGLTDEQIRATTFGIERNILCRNYAVNKNKLVGTYDIGNFLEMENEMQFNVIIGNPPYQHPTNKSQKLWTEFVSKSAKLLTDDGFLCMITPTGWLKKPTVRAFDSATTAISKGLRILHTDCNKFFNVGEDVCYWIVQNNYTGPYRILNKQTVSECPYHKEPIIFTDVDRIINSMKSKFTEGKTLRDVKIIDFYYSTASAVKNGKLSPVRSTDFQIPVFISAVKEYYTKKQFITPGFKLILNKSGYYVADPIEKYMVVTTDIFHGVGENGVGVPVTSIEEGENARKIYSKKLFRFFIDNEKTSGFNSGLLSLPVIDLTRAWTDNELYEYFNLTTEEITCIEANVATLC